MNKFFAVAAVAGSVLAASPAMAASNVCTASTPCEIVLFPAGAPVQFGTFTIGEVASATGLSSFYKFTIPSDGIIAGTVNNISVVTNVGIELSSIVFNEGLSGQAIAAAANGTTTNTLSLANVSATAGTQTLRVNYNVLTAGAATGNVSWTAGAVPEPGTWALMILGFGVVGYAMRRRPSVRFSQAI